MKVPKFIKDAATLFGGNAWAQALNVLAYVVLARLYSPEDFGIYNIFYSYIEVLIIVSTCKYEMAIVIADTDREAVAVSRLALRLNTIISVVLVAAVSAIYLLNGSFGGLGTVGDSSYDLQLLAFLIPPMVFFCGTSRVYTHLFNRYRQFKQIALSEILGSTTGVLSKVLFGLPRLATTVLHGWGLALGTVLGRVASNANYLIKKRSLGLPKDTSCEERRAAARKFRNFPLFTMPKDLVNSFSYNLPFLWLAFYFDKGEVGLFSMALMCTFRPVNVFNNVFEKLMYVRIAEKVRERKSIKSDLVRFFGVVSLIALPLFLVAFLFGDAILGFLLGGRWTESGYYLRCLLPWAFVALTSTSLMFIANIFSRQRTEFAIYLVLLLLRVAAVTVGVVGGDFRLSILLFSLSGAVVSAVLLVWYFALVRRYEASLSC